MRSFIKISTCLNKSRNAKVYYRFHHTLCKVNETVKDMYATYDLLFIRNEIADTCWAIKNYSFMMSSVDRLTFLSSSKTRYACYRSSDNSDEASLAAITSSVDDDNQNWIQATCTRVVSWANLAQSGETSTHARQRNSRWSRLITPNLRSTISDSASHHCVQWKMFAQWQTPITERRPISSPFHSDMGLNERHLARMWY